MTNPRLQGAAHIHRFLRFDPDALEEHANLAVDGGESPADQLRRAHRRVAAILNDKFDAAAAGSDLAEVKRMAQLFPLVGELEPGLAKYARYLAAQVATAAESLFRRKLGGEEGLTHGKLVSTLVEGIASMVQRETPFVTQHFGTATTCVDQHHAPCDVPVLGDHTYWVRVGACTPM